MCTFNDFRCVWIFFNKFLKIFEDLKCEPNVLMHTCNIIILDGTDHELSNRSVEN